jgi:hypothetical protein
MFHHGCIGFQAVVVHLPMTLSLTFRYNSTMHRRLEHSSSAFDTRLQVMISCDIFRWFSVCLFHSVCSLLISHFLCERILAPMVKRYMEVLKSMTQDVEYGMKMEFSIMIASSNMFILRLFCEYLVDGPVVTTLDI